MDLSAVFETWHLGDGNYPPLLKGMLVNLSFELEPDKIDVLANARADLFEHSGEANYNFRGEVIRVYKDVEDPDRLIVLNCAGFKFYISGCLASRFKAGEIVEGNGTLLLDHYLWVEFLDQYPEHPDLFYKLRVERIWKNGVPDKYISRTVKAVSYPTRIQHSEGESVEVEEIVSDSSISYYVVEFSNRSVEPDTLIPLTFLGA